MKLRFIILPIFVSSLAATLPLFAKASRRSMLPVLLPKP